MASSIAVTRTLYSFHAVQRTQGSSVSNARVYDRSGQHGFKNKQTNGGGKNLNVTLESSCVTNQTFLSPSSRSAGLPRACACSDLRVQVRLKDCVIIIVSNLDKSMCLQL